VDNPQKAFLKGEVPGPEALVFEETRTRELLALEILDTPRDPRFDQILEKVCEELGSSYARFSFIDVNRIWIKSKQGINIQEFPRAGSIEDLLIQSNLQIFQMSGPDFYKINEPFESSNPNIEQIYAVSIRSQSSVIVASLVLGFSSIQTYSIQFKTILLEAAARYADMIENRRVADGLLITLREQQEEIRIRYSSERIARTLANAVNDREHYHQVIEAFTQTILNEFDWWGCQLWFEQEHQLVSEKWIFGPSAPRNIFALESIFSPPIKSPLNEDINAKPYSATLSPLLDIAGMPPLSSGEKMEELGLRTFLKVSVAGPLSTEIQLIFLLPSPKSLPTRLRLTFENVITLLPQVLRRARSIEEINYRATHDELTGLLNRRGLDLEFAQPPAQDGSKSMRTVFFLDIDRFKLINDTYGHQIGDEVLIEFAQRLLKSSRPVDVIARLGGDEFVIVSQGFDSSDDIGKTSKRFLQNLGASFTTTNGTLIDPKVSIGISTWDSTETLVAGVANADKNMYEAKRRGGNQAVADGWVSSESFAGSMGENYSISYQSILGHNESTKIGLLARVKLPAFFAPKIISEIATQVYQRAKLQNDDLQGKSILLLDIVTISRSDRANTLSLVDSVAELVANKSKISIIVNMNSAKIDGLPLAREIIEHGSAQIALGNIFDLPFDLRFIDELHPTYFIRSTLPMEWDESEGPGLANKLAISLASEIGISVILPIEYSARYKNFFTNCKNVLYIKDEMES